MHAARNAGAMADIVQLDPGVESNRGRNKYDNVLVAGARVKEKMGPQSNIDERRPLPQKWWDTQPSSSMSPPDRGVGGFSNHIIQTMPGNR